MANASTDDFDVGRPDPVAVPPPLDRARLALAAAAGIALFCVGGVLVFPLQDLTVLIAYVYTPLFVLPPMIELIRQRQIRWLGGLYFLVGLTACHFAAVSLAHQIYLPPVAAMPVCNNFVGAPMYPDERAQRTCERNADAVRATVALYAGAAGGATGAALSFAGLLLLGRRFRRPGKLVVMLAATPVLGAIGAAGMAFTFPDKMRALQWVLQVFAPWQIVFAGVLIVLFDDRLFAGWASDRR